MASDSFTEIKSDNIEKIKQAKNLRWNFLPKKCLSSKEIVKEKQGNVKNFTERTYREYQYSYQYLN